MISFLKKSYIALGMDVAPRDSLKYKLHAIFKAGWQILSGLFLIVPIVRHYQHASRYDNSLWFRIKSPVLLNRAYISDDLLQKRDRSPAWYHVQHHFTLKSEHIVYNIDYALQAADVKGLALIYFMGMGDYFFTTPLIAALKRRYPHLPIIAYVSQNVCKCNAPMVATLLQNNPHISAVHMYDGKPEFLFKNYDYQDALRQMPEHYLALPMLYEYLPSTRHRVISLFETFGLALPPLLPKPIVHVQEPPAPHVTALLQSIEQACKLYHAKGVVFLQLDVRSSQYVYPYTDRLVADLNAHGFFVVSASKLSKASNMAHELDFKAFSINDSIALLKLLRDHFPKTYVVSVTSVFWSISSGLGIPNLGMYHFIDEAMHNTWYPNIYVITHHDYVTLPPSRRFLASKADYELNKSSQATFKPDFVMSCFDALQQDIEGTN